MCAEFEQRSLASFNITDNLGRDGLDLKYQVLLGDGSEMNGSAAFISRQQGKTTYSFGFEVDQLGTQILAIYFNERQLSNSPVRFLVTLRNCQTLYGRISDANGNCICKPNMYFEVSGSCIALAALLPSVIIPVVILTGIAIFLLHLHHAAQSEAMWRIKAADIVLSDPPEELGRGSLGVVFRGTFRDTPVAVKLFLTEPFASQGLASESGTFSRRVSSNSKNVNDANYDATIERPASSLSLMSSSERAGVDASLGFNNKRVRRGSSWNSPTFLPVGFAHYTESKGEGRLLDYIKALAKIRHPYVTTMMGATTCLPAQSDLQDRFHPQCLVMELMEMGTLHDLLRNRAYPLEAETALGFVQNIVQGVRFLHLCEPPVIHGDLKSKNVLVDRNFTAKISDVSFPSSSSTGTSLWMAPELLDGVARNTKESDVYSFGVVLFECLSREMPYANMDINEVRFMLACAKENRHSMTKFLLRLLGQKTLCILKLQAHDSSCFIT